MAQSRAQSAVSGSEWQTAWTDDAAGVTAWKAGNASAANASYTWWLSTHGLSDAMDTWHGLT